MCVCVVLLYSQDDEEDRRARRARRETQTPEERTARRADRANRRAAREQRKHAVVMHPRVGLSQDMEMQPMGAVSAKQQQQQQ